MSKTNTKGKPSCLGLFVKSWVASVLALSLMLAAGVGLGIRYFGWSAQSWSDFSTWTSYPVLACIGVGLVASATAFAVAAFIGLASAFLGKGGKGGGSSSKRLPSRPQSSRKTTV